MASCGSTSTSAPSAAGSPARSTPSMAPRKTKVRAGAPGDPQGQHNETLVAGPQLRTQTARPSNVWVKTKVRAGDVADPPGQHNETFVTGRSSKRVPSARPSNVRVKTKVRAGEPGDPHGNHNEVLVRGRSAMRMQSAGGYRPTDAGPSSNRRSATVTHSHDRLRRRRLSSRGSRHRLHRVS